MPTSDRPYLIRKGKRGFLIETTDEVAMHVQGDPRMADDPRTMAALLELMDAAKDRLERMTLSEARERPAASAPEPPETGAE